MLCTMAATIAIKNIFSAVSGFMLPHLQTFYGQETAQRAPLLTPPAHRTVVGLPSPDAQGVSVTALAYALGLLVLVRQFLVGAR